MPARAPWWDDVISSDTAHYYASSASARKDDGSGKAPGGSKGQFIWGDRVRRLKSDGNAVRVSGRGREYWVHKRHLGGEPLLEVYIIDVGQGDGILVVTPEGHNLMIDGGNIRRNQVTGKNAADFVDWKFARDYVNRSDRFDDDKTTIRLDALIATHNDIDHFGGLWDLLDMDAKNRAELDAGDVKVEQMYHAGLSWWWNGLDSKGRNKRSLGPTQSGAYTKLLGNRAAAKAATDALSDPDFDTLSGSWGRFIRSVVDSRRNSGAPTGVSRLSDLTGSHLPGFGPGEDSACTIRVLGPIEEDAGGTPGLKKFKDGDSKNTNGHSVVLRLDYGDRRVLLTGDLNTHSQHHIIDRYGADFVPEFKVDVAKGCHHGSHDVSYRFLEGLRPLVTVISSGDAETHDHPRPTIVAASAITGRRLIDAETDHLIAPMVYMTEVARSVALADISKMGEYPAPRPPFERKSPKGAKKIHDTTDEMSRFRLFLGSNPDGPFDWPRLDHAKVVTGIKYGLVNVRTDGQRLFIAQLEESGDDWAWHALTPQQIAEAR
jgi:beta-lactamase superfamily II metal-dependent hydrolase